MTASFGSSVLPADSPLSVLTEEQVNANEQQTFKKKKKTGQLALNQVYLGDTVCLPYK